MQVTAQLAQLSDYAAMQGQDQRHQHSQQGHTDASYGDCLGTHRFHHPRLAQRRQAGFPTPVPPRATERPIPLPYVTVDFREAGLQPLQQITSLDAPHRVYDAIIRDSLLDDVPFMESEQGRRLAAATPAAATALLEISPSALLFGAWHSQGEGGGLGAKFPRALVSEIMGVDTPVEELVRDRRTGRTEPQTVVLFGNGAGFWANLQRSYDLAVAERTVDVSGIPTLAVRG